MPVHILLVALAARTALALRARLYATTMKAPQHGKHQRACHKGDRGRRTTMATASERATNTQVCAIENAREMEDQPNQKPSRCSAARRAGWWLSG